MNRAGNGGGPSTPARRRLSVRDEVKPFVLIAAIAAGIAANRLAAGGSPTCRGSRMRRSSR